MKIFYRILLVFSVVMTLNSCEDDDTEITTSNYIKVDGEKFSIQSASYKVTLNDTIYNHSFYFTTENFITESSSSYGYDETVYMGVGVYFFTDTPTLEEGTYSGYLAQDERAGTAYLYYWTSNLYYYGFLYDDDITLESFTDDEVKISVKGYDEDTLSVKFIYEGSYE